jgi:hypothetical protein
MPEPTCTGIVLELGAIATQTATVVLHLLLQLIPITMLVLRLFKLMLNSMDTLFIFVTSNHLNSHRIGLQFAVIKALKGIRTRAKSQMFMRLNVARILGLRNAIASLGLRSSCKNPNSLENPQSGRLEIWAKPITMANLQIFQPIHSIDWLLVLKKLRIRS